MDKKSEMNLIEQVFNKVSRQRYFVPQPQGEQVANWYQSIRKEKGEEYAHTIMLYMLAELAAN